jgi:hypothetical protein
LGAAAYSTNANLFDDLFFSPKTPAYVITSAVFFTGKHFSKQGFRFIDYPNSN